MPDSTKLRVFLAHSNEDKPLVLEIYHLLRLDGFDPWLDVQTLVPGQQWQYEIEEAISTAHVVALFISPTGIDRAGYLHKETAVALEVADRQPAGQIYLVPILLGGCSIPRNLERLHWIKIDGEHDWVTPIYLRLQRSLVFRAHELKLVDSFKDYRIDGLRTKSVILEALCIPAGLHLVHGKNPSGAKYYGAASISIIDGRTIMNTVIDSIVSTYVESSRTELESLILEGPVEVTYTNSWRGYYEGHWGVGGTEQLMLASPFAG